MLPGMPCYFLRYITSDLICFYVPNFNGDLMEIFYFFLKGCQWWRQGKSYFRISAPVISYDIALFHFPQGDSNIIFPLICSFLALRFPDGSQKKCFSVSVALLADFYRHPVSGYLSMHCLHGLKTPSFLLNSFILQPQARPPGTAPCQAFPRPLWLGWQAVRRACPSAQQPHGRIPAALGPGVCILLVQIRERGTSAMLTGSCAQIDLDAASLWLNLIKLCVSGWISWDRVQEGPMGKVMVSWPLRSAPVRHIASWDGPWIHMIVRISLPTCLIHEVMENSAKGERKLAC